MRWKFLLTAILVLLGMLGGMSKAETRYADERSRLQETEIKTRYLSDEITPTAAVVGTVPASTFPVCRPPVLSAAPVILFLLQPSAPDEPALVVGQAFCARMTRYGMSKSQLVPLFFVVFPEKGTCNVNIEQHAPEDEPPPSQFVPGRMDAGHSIG